jgi:hypothetical protein
MEHEKAFLTEEQLNVLGDEINTSHTNYKHKSILDKYQLAKNDIITGVQCPECHEFGMTKHRRYWLCSNNHRSVKAHVKALEEYFLS